MAEVSTNMKLLVLTLLVIQNATQTLLMRYSRGVLNESYNPNVAVIMTECCKFSVCTILIILGIGESGLSMTHQSIISKIIYLIKNSGYTWVPATCYFIQNTLQYVASENLSSSVYGVLQQMKILSAALASVCILNKKLLFRQWRALLLLVAGGLLMEYHTFTLNDQGVLQNNNDPVKGTAAILTIVGLSGFAGVMTELLLKNKQFHGKLTPDNVSENVPKMSIWDRNIQLSFWSIIFGFISLLINRDWMYRENSLFDGFSAVTAFLIFIWTCGGLLVALTIKYTDVIIKGFASAISLILICLGGYMFLEDYLDIVFLIGATITIIATFNYNDREAMKDPHLNSTIHTRRGNADTNPIVIVDDSEVQPLKNTNE
eukprot:77000_1